jgi:S1-C subfamily serine protease
MRVRRSPTLLVVAAVAVLSGGGAAPAGIVAAPQHDEAEKLFFLLEYVGADYGAAVEDGAVVDAFEYREVEGFTRLLVERFDAFERRGVSTSTRAGLEELRARVLERAPGSEVRALVSRLATSLSAELRIPPAPATDADPGRSAEFYREHCAACHGLEGRGDGPAAVGLRPRPASFRDERMLLLSPRQVHGAISFGVDGTAMPAYGDALTLQDLWGLTFHVLSLREAPPVAPDPAVHVAAAVTRIVEGESAPEDGRRSAQETGAAHASDETRDLELALRLESAFARVAERLFPSVVGVTSLVREAEGPARSPKRREGAEPGRTPTGGSGEPAAAAWTQPGEEEILYPGFRRLRSGSGFVVSADGYVLTCRHLLLADGERLADAVDVELANRRHVLSRVVGVEPSLNLAVLKLEVLPEGRPPTLVPAPIGDSDRVVLGQWALALGERWGPGRSYAVGTFARLPERQCYQEELSATLLESSAQIHPEAWGGPLATIRGEVVGITTPSPAQLTGMSELAAGAGVPATSALPTNVALGIYEALKVKESRQSPWLGFSVLDMATARRRLRGGSGARGLRRTGVYIDDVFAPSPASRAGIAVGDSLVALDGVPLHSVLDFQKWLYLSGVGRTVDLEIVRGGETRHERVRIEARPPEAVPR